MADRDYDGYDDDLLPCPRCSGWGHVYCHCGGDLCVCENYGEAMCPLCCGEGDVTETDHNRYEEAQRENYRLLAEARAKIDGEKDAPTTDEVTK